MIQSLVLQWQKKAPEIKASIHRLCTVFGISRSWLYERCSKRDIKPPSCPICEAVLSAFKASGRTYGSRRICAELRRQGWSVGRYRIRQLMRKLALAARWRRKFTRTTDSQATLSLADNVLGRRFAWAASNQAWVSDITYVHTERGWLYLAAVMDLHSRKLIGWAMDDTMPASLVCKALQMAIDLQRPAPGLIVHSDRGCQYASQQHRQLLAQNGFIQSMSRKGNCWDNAVMERFFLNLKQKQLWHRRYANHLEAIKDINHYIVAFYNTKRLHSTLGYQSPTDYENTTQKMKTTTSKLSGKT